jgi:hypothetical protein
MQSEFSHLYSRHYKVSRDVAPQIASRSRLPYRSKSSTVCSLLRDGVAHRLKSPTREVPNHQRARSLSSRECEPDGGPSQTGKKHDEHGWWRDLEGGVDRMNKDAAQPEREKSSLSGL